MTTLGGGTAISGGGTPDTVAERRSGPFRLNLTTDLLCTQLSYRQTPTLLHGYTVGLVCVILTNRPKT